MFFLRGQEQCLSDATGYASKRQAIAAYESIARELARFGQSYEATLHVADCRANLKEYPEYALSLGPRGGVRCERA